MSEDPTPPPSDDATGDRSRWIVAGVLIAALVGLLVVDETSGLLTGLAPGDTTADGAVEEAEDGEPGEGELTVEEMELVDNACDALAEKIVATYGEAYVADLEPALDPIVADKTPEERAALCNELTGLEGPQLSARITALGGPPPPM